MQLEIRLSCRSSTLSSSGNDTFSHFPIECFLILTDCEVLIKLTLTTSQSTISAPPVLLCVWDADSLFWHLSLTMSPEHFHECVYWLYKFVLVIIQCGLKIISGQFYNDFFFFFYNFMSASNWGTKRTESSQSECDAPQCNRSLWGGVCCFMPLVTIIVVNAQPSSPLAWLRSESAEARCGFEKLAAFSLLTSECRRSAWLN